jgi:hypothetical protein
MESQEWVRRLHPCTVIPKFGIYISMYVQPHTLDVMFVLSSCFYFPHSSPGFEYFIFLQTPSLIFISLEYFFYLFVYFRTPCSPYLPPHLFEKLSSYLFTVVPTFRHTYLHSYLLEISLP